MSMVEKSLEVKVILYYLPTHIIVQVCKRLRNGNSFDLVEWLQAIEFIHNIADLNCIAIKLGAGSVVLKLQRNLSILINLVAQSTILHPNNNKRPLRKERNWEKKDQRKVVATFKRKDFINDPTTSSHTIPITKSKHQPLIMEEDNSITMDPVLTTPIPPLQSISDKQVPLGGRFSHFHQR